MFLVNICRHGNYLRYIYDALVSFFIDPQQLQCFDKCVILSKLYLKNHTYKINCLLYDRGYIQMRYCMSTWLHTLARNVHLSTLISLIRGVFVKYL